jgi:hypothetical protein
MQFIAVAKVALSFLHIHHPTIDLDDISRLLPAPPGGGRIPMAPHYSDAHRPAMWIIRRMLDEDQYFFINFDV